MGNSIYIITTGQLARRFLILAMILVFKQGISQENVNNIRINKGANEIIINYDLKSDAKNGYADFNQLVKVYRFTVELYYSTDEGKTYHKVNNGSGAIGDTVSAGENKKIRWQPTVSNYGYIGNLTFKMAATPVIPKVSVGFSYTGTLIRLADYYDKSKAGKFAVNIYFRQRSTNLFIPIAFASSYKDMSYDYASYSVRVETKTFGFFTGIGMQSRKRGFSTHIAGGYARMNNIRETTENGPVEIELYSWGTAIFDVGFSVKVIDSKSLTIQVPFGYMVVGGVHVIYYGVGVQF